MLASNKWYKGINEFVMLSELAEKDHACIEFNLYLNGSYDDVEKFRIINKNSKLNVHHKSTDIEHVFSSSHLNLNLSRVDGWIETFGLTILEAKCFGVPSIAPPIGGPTELITNDYDGYILDSRDVEIVYRHIKRLSEDRYKLAEMRTNAIKSMKPFRSEVFEKNIGMLLDDIKTQSCSTKNVKNPHVF